MSFDTVKARLLDALRAHLSSPGEVADGVAVLRQALRPDAVASSEEGSAEKEKEEGGAEIQVLELVMRMHMEDLLRVSKQPGQSIEAAGVPQLLDLAIALAAADVADCNTPFALLEDLFDAHVISVAESGFALVEARAAALAPFLTAEKKHQRCKLTLIRSCNELLRRLSKSKNTNFRGRVLMFLAYAFPLGERSGVNLKGVSARSTVEAEEEGGDEAMRVDSGAEGAAGGDGGGGGGEGVVDFGFYATFWGLQQAFADPAASVGRDKWAGLVENLNTVLQVFGSFSGSADEAEEAAAAGGGGGAGGGAAGGEATEGEGGGAAAAAEADAETDAAMTDASEALEAVYFAKFLTSSKLMTLQLRDGYFRRHVLVQVLIFLQTVTTERKNQPALSAAQRQQVDSLHAKCVELLTAIPPGGARFSSAVLLMLEREEHWIQWKANGCVPFDKAAATAREEGEAGVSRKRKIAAGGGGPRKMQLGNSALTRLWNMGGNSLEDLAQRQQEAMPALAEYLRQVHEQMDPEAGIEEEYKLVNDKAFTWKALRLMAKKDVALLSKVSAPQGSLEAAVKYFFEQQEGGGDAKKDAADEGPLASAPPPEAPPAEDKMKVEL
jgi:THO complex subunit 1